MVKEGIADEHTDLQMVGGCRRPWSPITLVLCLPFNSASHRIGSLPTLTLFYIQRSIGADEMFHCTCHPHRIFKVRAELSRWGVRRCGQGAGRGGRAGGGARTGPSPPSPPAAAARVQCLRLLRETFTDRTRHLYQVGALQFAHAVLTKKNSFFFVEFLRFGVGPRARKRRIGGSMLPWFSRSRQGLRMG